MHQHLKPPRQEPVIDEEVLFEREPRVSPLEISNAVVRDSVPQREILRAVEKMLAGKPERGLAIAPRSEYCEAIEGDADLIARRLRS